MKGLLFTITGAFALCLFCSLTACGEDSTKSCVHPVYCVYHTPTGLENGKQCWEDKSIAESNEENYTKEGTFIKSEEDCWDM